MSSKSEEKQNKKEKRRSREEKKEKRRSRELKKERELCDRCVDSHGSVNVVLDDGSKEFFCKACALELDEERNAKKDGTINFRYVASEHFDNLFTVFQNASYEEYEKFAEDPEFIKYVIEMMIIEDKHLDFLATFVIHDIQETDDEQKLFQGNSVGVKIITAFLAERANEYVCEVLQPSITKICKDPSKLEIDLSKIPAGEDAVENQNRLSEHVQHLFESIFASIEACPADVRLFLEGMRLGVETKFENRGVAAVNAFLFQKLFCPAIITPEKFKILDTPPSAEARRALIVVSKTVLAASRSAVGEKSSTIRDLKSSLGVSKIRKELALFIDQISQPAEARKRSGSRLKLKKVRRITLMSELLQRANLHFGAKYKNGVKCDYFEDIQDVLNSDQPILDGKFVRLSGTK